ncbi:MAG TPA: 50S ribosomal protein L37ae [Methanosarcinales archaeon]|nr:50S ribosomal protein L37ae [Methanosarcinales archaeon]
MAKKYTKKGRKSRSAGRFGARYGRKARKLVADLEEKMRMKHKCPQCDYLSIKRISTGVWKCKKCGYTFAGGTYVPYTSVGISAQRSVKKAIEQKVE